MERLQRRFAFTLLELLTTVAIIAILAALLLPALQSGYGKARRIACASNLKNVGAAFHAWAHDHNDMFPMQVFTNTGGTREFAEATTANPDASFAYRHFQALSNQLVLPKPLACPADKQRLAASNFPSLRNENVSYWINPAAAFGQSDSPVAGDRNVRTSGRTEWTFIRFGPGDVVEFSAELHGYRGNVLFGDAHVDALESRALRLAFASSNAVAEVLSIPRPDVPRIDVANPDLPSQTSGSRLPDAQAGVTSSDGSSGNKQASTETESLRTPSPPSRDTPPHSGHDGNKRAIVITRLDGNVVTSSVPETVTSATADRVEMAAVTDRETHNPVIEFVQWLGQLSARSTYWLLFLLLLALIAFEVARRRAQRKRKSAQ